MRRQHVRISRETSVLEKWKAPRGSEANASEGTQGMKISIVSGLAVSWRGRKRDEIKSYTVIAVFFSGGSRAYTSGVLAPAISRPTSLLPPTVLRLLSSIVFNHPLAQLFPVLLFVQRIPGHRQLVGTRPVQYDVSKNVLRAYLSVLLVGAKKTMPFSDETATFVCSFHLHVGWIVVAFQLT